MKKLVKILSLSLAVVIASSCDLELQEDPNAIRLDQINPTLLLNKIQLDFAAFFNAASTFGMHYTRMQNSGQADYENTNRPTAFDNLWTLAYANVLNDAHTLLPLADEQGLTRHAGIARVLQAYTLLTLVDYFGDVPFSQAFQGLNNLNPEVDDMAGVYDAALEILTRATTDFNTAPNPTGVTVFDFYYGGTAANWIRLINSLRLKIYLNLRDVDEPRAIAGINQVLLPASGGVISAQNHNFVFRYATSTADPDSRHPRWTNNYLTGAGDYIANYLMWQMYFGYDMRDPRMRFYFYRQTLSSIAAGNPNNIRCILELRPAHYPTAVGSAVVPGPGGLPPGINPVATNAAWSRTFCFPTPDFYWGRDHVDPQGIPPDGLLRTTWGSYPVGGRFDAGNGLNVTSATTFANSMQGAGFQPIMMRSFVSFMIAEADLYLILGAADGTAATRYEEGIRSSIQDVRDWAVNGTFGSNAFGASPNQGNTINTFYPVAGSVLASVRAATTANLTALSGLLTVDGVALAAGDRVLVKNQSTASQNGIYIADAGAWTRATDADAEGELLRATVTVLAGAQGDVTVNRQWAMTTAAPIQVGTTGLTWSQTFTGDVERYVAAAVGGTLGFSTAALEQQRNLVAREYWIALFGNGVESFNLYRRTGKPTGMQPAIAPNPGNFPRSLWYPVVFETRNSNVSQKPNLNDPVFWNRDQTNLNF